MLNQTYEINGRVIEAKTRQGLFNLIVEAWDKDVKYDDLLAQTFTNDDGGFTMSFDSTYFRDFDPETNPDLLFKVFMGKKLLKSTGDAVIKNAGQKTEVTIEINMPEIRKEGKDRVSIEQACKAADFFQQSDFKGVFNQFKSKAGTSLGFLSDMLMNTVKKMDIKPIKVSSRNENIVGKDVTSATQSLESQNIAVNEVKTYEPSVNKASIADFASFPVNLRSGQKVNLYEEDGRVRYYSLVKEKAVVNEVTESQNTEVIKLNNELNMTRQKAAEKDEQINKLQQEMDALRKDHDEIKTLLKSDAVVQLLQQINKPVQSGVKATVVRKKKSDG